MTASAARLGSTSRQSPRYSVAAPMISFLIGRYIGNTTSAIDEEVHAVGVVGTLHWEFRFPLLLGLGAGVLFAPYARPTVRGAAQVFAVRHFQNLLVGRVLARADLHEEDADHWIGHNN